MTTRGVKLILCLIALFGCSQEVGAQHDGSGRVGNPSHSSRLRKKTGMTVYSRLLAKAATAHQVTIQLRDRVQVSGPVVLIGDVARLTGGPSLLRARIAKLDLEDVAALPTNRFAISANQISLRVRLAGISASLFRTAGAKNVQATVGWRDFAALQKKAKDSRRSGTAKALRTLKALSADDIVAVAKQELERRLPWPATDVDIQHVNRVVLPYLELNSADAVKIEATLPASRNMIGRVRVNVTILVNNKRHSQVAADFVVGLYQEVIISKQRIGKGETLTKENTTTDRRATDGATRYLTLGKGLLNRQAKRTIYPGQVLVEADVTAPAAADPILVKSRDSVKMIVRIGKIQVAATGQAMQQGREGEWIRVRNTRSRAIVRGRVVSRGVVEVEN